MLAGAAHIERSGKVNQRRAPAAAGRPAGRTGWPPKALRPRRRRREKATGASRPCTAPRCCSLAHQRGAACDGPCWKRHSSRRWTRRSGPPPGGAENKVTRRAQCAPSTSARRASCWRTRRSGTTRTRRRARRTAAQALASGRAGENAAASGADRPRPSCRCSRTRERPGSCRTSGTSRDRAPGRRT
eukprot:7169614-Prymnesium_polylepis.1